MNNPALAAAAAVYNARVDDALSVATSHGSMIQSRVTRELIKAQARQSNVSNLLAAIYAGLVEGCEDPALRPYCEMAMEEIGEAMKRISLRHPNRAAN